MRTTHRKRDCSLEDERRIGGAKASSGKDGWQDRVGARSQEDDRAGNPDSIMVRKRLLPFA
jgi:hypothetical protein